MDRLVGTIKTRSDEEIRISLRETHGGTFVEIRTYYKPSRNDPVPTRKGVAFPPQIFPRVKRAVLALEDVLLKRRLRDPEGQRGAKGKAPGQPQAR